MPEYRELPVKDLIVDPRYQRELDEKRVKRMVENFNPNLLGVLQVTETPVPNQYAVWEGQHRLELLRRLGIDTVWCQISDDADGVHTSEDQALLFEQAQKERKNLSWDDLHKSRCFRNDKDSADIEQIVNTLGFRVGGATDRSIGAVGSLYEIYKNYGPDTLQSSIYTAAQAWHAAHGRGAFGDRILRGLAHFYRAYEGQGVDPDDVARALKNETPKGLIQAAGQKSRGATGTNAYREFSRVVANVYNRQVGRKLRLSRVDDLSQELRKQRATVSA